MPHVKPRQYVPWMTLEEISRRTGRNTSLLARWARAGRIPAVKIGGAWIVNESDLPAIEAMPRTPGRPRKAVPLADLPEPEQRVIRALIAAKDAADKRRKEKRGKP